MADADLDLAVEGALFSGFGTAGQRCTSLGTAIVHDAVHDEFLAPLRPRAVEAGADRRPDAGRALRPDDPRALPRALRGAGSGSIRDHHTVHGSTGTGRITAEQPARGLRRRPRARALLPPDDRRRRDAPTTSCYTTETFGPIVGVARFSRLRRGDRARQRPRLRPLARRSTRRPERTRSASASAISAGMVSVNNSTSRRRGAPALRRQRPVGQRLAPVGHLGARPVHPLAVDELGLRRPAAEGADGRRRRRRRPVVPAAGLSLGGARGGSAHQRLSR